MRLVDSVLEYVLASKHESQDSKLARLTRLCYNTVKHVKQRRAHVSFGKPVVGTSKALMYN